MDTLGILRKMTGTLQDGRVSYRLDLEKSVSLTACVGQLVKLTFLDEKECIGCGRKIAKTFQQGYCFPCVRSLAACDICIVRPELCHFHLGTCRESEWGEAHCMKEHVIYLANTSGLKVGITRRVNVPTRFIDQGATEALPLFSVKSRYHAGLMEVLLAKELSDKTNWRKMLSGSAESLDLPVLAEELKVKMQASLQALSLTHQIDFTELPASVIRLEYPVQQYPVSVKSLNLDKVSPIEGVLLGIKGQYLILSSGVFNVRSFGGYKIRLSLFETI